MLIPPKYILTQKIVELLQSIEASREVINSINLPKEVEQNIRRKSSLKSSLFSARIEGNPLTLNEISTSPSKDQKKREVFNLLKAINHLQKRGSKRDITTKDLLILQQITMHGLISTEHIGKFRKEVSAIFNAAGIAVYMPPLPLQAPGLVEKLLKFSNSEKERFVPIRACLAHYNFEKVHPFLDGNGRIGRLLLQAILVKFDYGMKGLSPIEEYLDNNRTRYYLALEAPEKEVSDYLEFMLEAIAKTAEVAKLEVLKKKEINAEDLLLPRRAEILNIIKDHKLVNFDILRRRFMIVNERTLRYDLKQLTDDGFIKKRGTTKGVWYEPIN